MSACAQYLSRAPFQAPVLPCVDAKTSNRYNSRHTAIGQVDANSATVITTFFNDLNRINFSGDPVVAWFAQASAIKNECLQSFARYCCFKRFFCDFPLALTLRMFLISVNQSVSGRGDGWSFGDEGTGIRVVGVV